MDEETELTNLPSVGDRLRAAREEKGFSLEDLAAETRIPRRHLESLENSDWERLPAPTYTIGFAKSYASAVGLDRAEISDQLRGEMGGYRTDTATIETFEPVDPARTMPKWLVISAIAGIILIVILFTWMRERELTAEDAPPPVAEGPANPAPAQQPPQPAAAQGPVVLTAVAPAWIQVKDQGQTLFEGMLNPGQRYEVPATATAPLLRAGAPEALRVTVGTAVAPPVGPAGQVASNVSLLPADLMRGPQPAGASPVPSAQPQPAPAPRRTTAAPRQATPPPPPAQEPAPPPQNSLAQ